MNDLTNLLKDEWVISSINDSLTIPPAHITIIPTSKTSIESEGTDVDFKELCNVIDIYKRLGTRAVTITGVSPSSHPEINNIIDYINSLNIDAGLIDNGESIDRIFPRTLNKLKWCKLVHTDHRSFNGRYENMLKNVVSGTKDVDWSFIYEVTEIPNFYGIVRTVNFANENGFSRVDISLPDMDIEKVSKPISSFVGGANRLVFYETKSAPSISPKCFVSFLKPVIKEDSHIYPCINKIKTPICSFSELEDFISKNQKSTDGCSLCNFTDYNKLLKKMMRDNKHPNFV